MAISICGECKGKISTNAEVCPHCGNKITQDMFNSQNVCKINGIDYDFTPLMKDILNDEIYESTDKSGQLAVFIMELTNCAETGVLYLEIHDANGQVPAEFNGCTMDEMDAQTEAYYATRPKCPTCGSTDIHKIGFGERSMSVNLFGLSSKKFNKTFECENCGYTW